jgi:hypothetical protein
VTTLLSRVPATCDFAKVALNSGRMTGRAILRSTIARSA